MQTSLARRRKENTAAVLLEIIPGFFLQTFGIGHLAQGRVGMGLFIMGSYWLVQAFNLFVLTWLFGLGYVTAILTGAFYLIAAPLNAAGHEGTY